MTKTVVRYARVQSTITDDNSDDGNVNQLQTIDSEEEEEEIIPPPVKTSSKNESANKLIYKRANHRNSIITTGLLILCYFILSIGLTFYQRWLLKANTKFCQFLLNSNVQFPTQGYKFPFSVVIYHLFVKLVMSTLIRIFYRIFTGKHRVKIPVAVAVRKVAPTSFFGALDIGFSQWGLEFVDVAL